MSKRFLISALAFAVGVASCGSGSRDAADGGDPPGAGGSTGGSTAGADGARAPDAPYDGPLDEGGLPLCDIDTFCSVYLYTCGTTTPGYTTMAECMATFSAIGATNPYKQQCESYHLCLAIFDTGSDRTLHCGHAVGVGNLCGY